MIIVLTPAFFSFKILSSTSSKFLQFIHRIWTAFIELSAEYVAVEVKNKIISAIIIEKSFMPYL